MNRLNVILGAGLGLLLALPAGLSGQLEYGDGWGIQWQIGHKQFAGGWGDLLDGGYDGEINGFYNLKKFRIGAGGNFASFDFDKDLSDGSLSSIELHAFGNYTFLRGPFQPYVQLRGTWIKLRPEADHDEDAEFDPEAPEPGENTAPTKYGFGVGGAAGAEYRLSYSLGVEALLSYDVFSTEDVDLTEAGIDLTFSSGSKWGFRVGINWYL